MVAPVQPPQLVRLSPSGAELGSPPAQIGGGGALIAGRTWFAQGTGDALVNTPNPAASVPGLTSVPVDMRAGYQYDIEVDAQFFGTTGNVQITLNGVSGVTPPSVINSSHASTYNGSNRLHLTNVTGVFDHLYIEVSSTSPAAATCQYLPKLTALKVTEYSSS